MLVRLKMLSLILLIGLSLTELGQLMRALEVD